MNSLIRNIRSITKCGQLNYLQNTLKKQETGFLQVYKPEFEHVLPKKGNYQKLLLHEEDLFEIYYIKWRNNAVSGIHAHPNEKCVHFPFPRATWSYDHDLIAITHACK